MNDASSAKGGWESNIKRQTVKLGYWTGAWLISMALATFGPIFLWQGSDLFSVIAIGVNLLIGLGMINANKDHLRSLDELQQKIYLEAMGLTLGIGLVVGLAYSSLDQANIIPGDAEISHVVLLMGLTYLTTLVFLNRKYR